MSVSLGMELQAFDGMEAALNAQLAPLCSRVESELGKPAVILVTSAVDGDGKGMTAHSLAGCFAHFGHRAALVSPRPGATASRGVTPVELSLQDGETIGQDRLTALVGEMRSNHDFTIVDGGTFLSSGCAAVLARLVDGILLVVRAGRVPVDEDRLTLQTIEHCRGRIIGVIMTSDAALIEFERRHAGNRPASGGGSAAAKVYQRVLSATGKIVLGNSVGNTSECSIP